jgi:preprotein translocase subunit SecG
MVIDAIIAVILIATIVLQSGKSAGMGGSIGGGADQGRL